MLIYCVNVNKNEACGFYRSFGPLSELHKLDPSVRIGYLSRFSITECKGADLIIFQRPTEEDHFNQLCQIKKIGIPVIIDYDDNMMEIPDHNPFHKLQELQGNDYKTYVKMCCYLANQIWVTTGALKEQLSEFCEDIKIIPNAFDDYLYKAAVTSNKTKTIIWRGSQHHEQDLNTFREELTELITKNRDFHFVFMGEKFPKWIKELASLVPNMGQVNFVNVYEYIFTLQGLRPSLMLVPLEDSPFNRSKSDINLLEAVVVGSHAITPLFPEWEWNRYCGYSNNDEFLKQAQAFCNMARNGEDKKIDDIWQGLVKYILDNRRLSDINKLRALAMEEL